MTSHRPGTAQTATICSKRIALSEDVATRAEVTLQGGACANVSQPTRLPLESSSVTSGACHAVAQRAGG